MELGKRIKEETEGKILSDNNLINPTITKGEVFNAIKERDILFDKLYQKQVELYENATKNQIEIILKDGKILKGVSFETTSMDIAKKISKKLAEKIVVSKVRYIKKENPIFGNVLNPEAELFSCCSNNNIEEIYDLNRPLEGDCYLELLEFSNPEAKSVFWHSAAHVLGRGMEQNYGALLTHGPPIDNGFFYDSFIGNNKVTEKEYETIEKHAEELIKADKQFLRLIISKENALEMFKYNPFKVSLIKNKIPDNSLTSVYKCGDLIDLCTGPHVVSTGKIKAFKIMKNSASYWLGKAGNDNLQRVYGTAYPSKKELDEYIKMLQELAKRDHRNIGESQSLFLFDPLSPGSAFFMPNGIKIINKLMELMRKEYLVRGITEVQSPNIFKNDLWKLSGHYYKYKSNMFFIKTEDEGDYGVKPMNCPAHCVMFRHGLHSYKDLPIRYADFGVLHRNEISGALSGLTRVRRFQQDDAHIFCRDDQIMTEILDQLDLMDYIFGLFKFNYKLELSTKPEMHMGDDKLWETAESALNQALEKFGKQWTINHGDGAFYGPKIDIKVLDCYKREHQLATIQLDFNLPERFNLQYKTAMLDINNAMNETYNNDDNDDNDVNVDNNENVNNACDKSMLSDGKTIFDDELVDKFKAQKLRKGFKRPIIIHRAILGSLERCLAILCEHYGGKWPFWLSPKQLMIIPVSEKYIKYAERVANRFKLEGYFAEFDSSNTSLNKKIRNAQLEQYNFILVVGEKEESDGTVTVRERDAKKEKGTFKIFEFLEELRLLEPENSERYNKLLKDSFFNKEEKKYKMSLMGVTDELLDLWEEQLKLKSFFSGNGFEFGEEDRNNYKIVKDYDINKEIYLNIYKWKMVVENLINNN